MLGGGAIADARARTDRRWLMWVPAIGLAASVPIYIAALWSVSLPLTVAGLFLSAIGAFTYYGTTIAAVQDMAPPRMRAVGLLPLLLRGDPDRRGDGGRC